MNKKLIPVSILVLIVILCIAILVQNLAAPSAIPAPTVPTSTVSYVTPAVQNQPASPTLVFTPPDTEPLTMISLQAPNGALRVQVASTSSEQAQGLGDRDSLSADQGMLFPFRYPGDYGFWMKDMHFSLDMVWISSNKKVVGITPNISPDSYPTVFYPPLAISYVLELNAGAAKEFGIATDTQLVF